VHYITGHTHTNCCDFRAKFCYSSRCPSTRLVQSLCHINFIELWLVSVLGRSIFWRITSVDIVSSFHCYFIYSRPNLSWWGNIAHCYCCTSATCSVYWGLFAVFWSTIFIDGFESIKIASDVSEKLLALISQSFCSTWGYFIVTSAILQFIDSCRFVWVDHGYCSCALHHRAYSYKLLWFQTKFCDSFKKPNIHLPCTSLCHIISIELWLGSVLGTLIFWQPRSTYFVWLSGFDILVAHQCLCSGYCSLLYSPIFRSTIFHDCFGPIKMDSQLLLALISQSFFLLRADFHTNCCDLQIFIRPVFVGVTLFDLELDLDQAD